MGQVDRRTTHDPWGRCITVQPMTHGKGSPHSLRAAHHPWKISSPSIMDRTRNITSMGHGLYEASYGIRMAHDPWVFCHSVSSMTHGKKVAETCVCPHSSLAVSLAVSGQAGWSWSPCSVLQLAGSRGQPPELLPASWLLLLLSPHRSSFSSQARPLC